MKTSPRKRIFLYVPLVVGALICFWIDRNHVVHPGALQQNPSLKARSSARVQRPHISKDPREYTSESPVVTSLAAPKSSPDATPSAEVRDEYSSSSSTAPHLDAENPEISEAQDQTEAVMATWKEEKDQFYRETLGLDDSEIEQIDAVSQAAGDLIQEAVQRLTMSPPTLSDEDFHAIVDSINRDQAVKVAAFMGQQRFSEAVQFRSIFNSELESRFAVRMRISGF